MQTEPRYYVFDRAATQAADLTHFSPANPRYWVIDRFTATPVDEFASKRAAIDTARAMSQVHEELSR